MTTIRVLVALLLAMPLTSACAVPSLHGIADEGTLEFNESLLGDWFDSEDTRFAVTKAAEGRYAITLHPEEEDPLELTAALVLVGDSRILDVSLSKTAAEDLEERYGAFLVMTHQFYRLETTASSVLLEALDQDWLQGSSAYADDVGDMGLIVSDSADLFWLIEKALADEDAWSEAMELGRSAESSPLG